eukprot:347172-Chlamydomonas_euryale.AAC.2
MRRNDAVLHSCLALFWRGCERPPSPTCALPHPHPSAWYRGMQCGMQPRSNLPAGLPEGLAPTRQARTPGDLLPASTPAPLRSLPERPSTRR